MSPENLWRFYWLPPQKAKMITAWTLIKWNKRQDDFFLAAFLFRAYPSIGHILQFYERIRAVCSHLEWFVGCRRVSNVRYKNSDAPYSSLNACLKLHHEKVLKTPFFLSSFRFYCIYLLACMVTTCRRSASTVDKNIYTRSWACDVWCQPPPASPQHFCEQLVHAGHKFVCCLLSEFAPIDPFGHHHGRRVEKCWRCQVFERSFIFLLLLSRDIQDIQDYLFTLSLRI